MNATYLCLYKIRDVQLFKDIVQTLYSRFRYEPIHAAVWVKDRGHISFHISFIFTFIFSSQLFLGHIIWALRYRRFIIGRKTDNDFYDN